jgi:hypothetical protein
MLTRSLAILLAPWLPIAAVLLPFEHRIGALAAGVAVTVLSGFAFSSDRARVAGAVVAGLVALTALVSPTTLAEEAITLSWGTLMFAWLVGPLSAPPLVTRAAPAPVATSTDERHVPLAA